MNRTAKVALITAAVAIPAFILGAGGPVNQATHFWGKVWPFGADEMSTKQPSAGQLPFFIVLGVAEAVTFGLAVSFLVYGWPLVKRVASGSRAAQVALFASGAWVLGNWWVHDSLHMTNSSDFWSLLTIEYGFHVTLMVAGGTICWQLYKAWSRADVSTLPAADARGVVAVKSR